MILFFKSDTTTYYAIEFLLCPSPHDIKKLSWLVEGVPLRSSSPIVGYFIGPRKELRTPWSSNAVAIANTMGIRNVERMEVFIKTPAKKAYDSMLNDRYQNLGQNLFKSKKKKKQVHMLMI